MCVQSLWLSAAGDKDLHVSLALLQTPQDAWTQQCYYTSVKLLHEPQALGCPLYFPENTEGN